MRVSGGSGSSESGGGSGSSGGEVWCQVDSSECVGVSCDARRCGALRCSLTRVCDALARTHTTLAMRRAASLLSYDADSQRITSSVTHLAHSHVDHEPLARHMIRG
jgi:hypothetical protein